MCFHQAVQKVLSSFFNKKFSHHAFTVGVNFCEEENLNMKNKQKILFQFILIFSIFISINTCFSQSNKLLTDEFKFKEINNIDDLKSLSALDSNKKMIDIGEKIKGVVLDLRYATTNNFMHRKMYPENTCFSFLRLPVLSALAQVQNSLKKKGLGIKIFDAYRPFEVTKQFWELVHDEKYVANPAKGSGHNRGTSVDLTLIILPTKVELNMGTNFDNFSDSAHHSFYNFGEKILNNRKLLKETMEHFGFTALETEWWHYSWNDAEKFEVLNISFQELKKINNTIL